MSVTLMAPALTSGPLEEPVTLDRLAEVAHELRTPLGGIEAMAAALGAAGLPPEQARMADALLASARHLRAVAAAILSDYREASGGPPLPGEALSPTELRSWLDPIAAATEFRAAEKGILFVWRIGEGLPPRMLLRRTELRQMLENLLDNALKATEAGEIRLDIDRVGRRKGLHLLRFAVRDSGRGFAPDIGESLFERFGAPTNAPGGAGIGLSLVRRFARSMGGDAAAETRPGEGASVWFTILAEADRSAPATDRRPPPACAPERHAPAPGAAEILVVDDNETSRVVLSVVLEQFGFVVTQAASGAEALGRVRDGAFAAVMMDMMMAGLDGPETTRAIRALPGPAAATPVIAVTGRVSDRDREIFRGAGASALVAKPISPDAVWSALKLALPGPPGALVA